MSVEVRYMGHLGNNLFQYALGRILAEELGLSLACMPATDEPGWNDVERASGIVDRLDQCNSRFADVPQRIAGRTLGDPQIRYVYGEKPLWDGQGFNMEHVLKQGADHRIVLRGYFQNIDYVHPWRERIRRWFALPGAAPIELHRQDIVVHLRQSLDMLLLDRAIDLDFYPRWLESLSFRKLYVCGLGLDARVRAVLAPFKPVYVDLPAIDTLKLMTTARRIVIANSTFSWWGAYLSDAEEIHYPRVTRNFWGPDSAARLEVPEARYVYVDDVPVHRWQPLRLRTPARLQHARDGDELPTMAFGTTPDTTFVRFPAALLAVATWLCARGCEPFGMHEVHALDLPADTLGNAVKLLREMHRHHLLVCESGSERLLAA